MRDHSLDRPGQGLFLEESERLSTLWQYDILDPLPEKRFDDIAEAAAKACDSPFALVSFVDKDRQWFKAKIGLEFDQMDRESSFCQYCIRSSEGVFEIPDTHEDPTFAQYGIVKRPPYVRFYAGAPIRVKEGYALGTVCIMDRSPRTLSSDQRRILKILADQVKDALELRLSHIQLNRDREKEISKRVVESEVEERQRIGQELHDGVVQTLTAARMHLDMLREKDDFGSDKEEVLDRLQEMLDHANTELRGVGHSLMGKKVREKGFQRSVEDLAGYYHLLNEAPEVCNSLELDPGCLNDVEAINLFRVVQEFVQNSVKHSGAQRIDIRGGVEERVFWMSLEDDGVGIDEEAFRKLGGMENMQHRIRSLGAECHFAAPSENGSSLYVELELAKDRASS